MTAPVADRPSQQCWALAGLGLGVAVLTVGVTLRLLVRLDVAAAVLVAAGVLTTVVVLALGRVPALAGAGGRVLRESVVAVGFAVFSCLVYTVVVIGFDRRPEPAQRGLVGLLLVSAVLVGCLGVPLRARLRELAQSLAPGAAVRPSQALDNLSARMTRAVPMDELLLQMAETLHAATAPDGAEIWVASEDGLVCTVAVPHRKAARIMLGTDDQTVVARARVSGNAWIGVWLPALLTGSDGQLVRVAPISHLGALLGLIVVRRPEGARPFTEDEESDLAELARHTGLALHNVRLDSALQASLEELQRRNVELQASRARIVAAADASRRRIERDLHDGAQQHLVAMAVRIGLARSIVAEDPSRTDAVLEDFRTAIQATLVELRALAHGIYPPLLRDRGLGEALRNAAGRASLPVEVDVDLDERLSPDVEAAVYFCCLEAVNNAGKHAGDGATVAVCVRRQGEDVVFEVTDNGRGCDVQQTTEGQGFLNMRDRVGAYGGDLSIASTPGSGACVRGRVPVGTGAQNPPT